MPIVEVGINPAQEQCHLFPHVPSCDRAAMPNVFALAALYARTARADRNICPAAQRAGKKSDPCCFGLRRSDRPGARMRSGSNALSAPIVPNCAMGGGNIAARTIGAPRMARADFFRPTVVSWLAD